MAKTQYVIYEHGYKVAFSGFAYVQADSEEEAKEKFDDGYNVYKETNLDSVEEVDEMPIDLT